MKLFEIPLVSLVELQFEYMGEPHKVSTVLVYRVNETVYVSAIKSAGYVIPATKLRNVTLKYKTVIGVYTFRNLEPRSISYNGQNFYAMNSDENAQISDLRNASRLFLGVRIAAKVFTPNGEASNLHCVLKDISMTGMGILTNQKLDKMTKIEITFRVNKERNEKLVGNIMHINEFTEDKGFLYGCEFDEPNELIAIFVAKKQKQMATLKNKQKVK